MQLLHSPLNHHTVRSIEISAYQNDAPPIAQHTQRMLWRYQVKAWPGRRVIGLRVGRGCLLGRLPSAALSRLDHDAFRVAHRERKRRQRGHGKPRFRELP